ncbi:ABC transporter ATP-binding protein/permease [Enterococcus crotali]|uniref:ABC transporter ATP-binding protein/permease n=1 Tax=Enterococcus crotali TaxID=1453587 RepID=UPI00046F00FC|nr:ABC transporter ATP-binding protein/permease [Enterococcus crotali]
MSILTLKSIKKSYSINEKEEEQVLDGIDLDVQDGEFLALLGPSGCGKSTLLNIISGLDTDYEGDVLYKGTSLKFLNDHELTDFRKNNIGFVFQNFNLISHMSVLENTMIPMYLNGNTHSENKKKALELLDSVGLKKYADKNVKNLSGGQKQRVAIARALTNEPELIIADEPTGSLDSKSQNRILEILEGLTQQGKTVIVVTHNEEITERVDTVVKLRDGQIVEVEQKKDRDFVEPNISKEGKKNRFNVISMLKIAFSNFMQRKWRNIMISFATSIGLTGILLSLGLGNGIVKIIEQDMDGGKIPSQIQISLNSQQSSGIINENDLNYIKNKVGQEKIKYFEAPFGMRMIEVEVEGEGKADYRDTTPNYSQVVSLYDNISIKVPSNTKDSILAGKEYKNPKEEGITLTESFIKDFNKLNKKNLTADSVIGKKLKGMIVESTSEGEKTGVFSTKIVRIVKDETEEENSYMAPVEMERIVTQNKFEKNIPYFILELKEPSENKQVMDQINSNKKYVAISQTAVVDIIINFIKIIQGLLIFMSTQAVVVSVVMIGIVMYINVIERTREIGVMKAIGYRNRDINMIFTSESAFITLLSLLLALLFASFIGFGINEIVAMKAKAISSVFMLDIVAIGGTVILAIVMSLFSASVPMMKVGKLDPATSLRYE